jgi:hypothetical protein
VRVGVEIAFRYSYRLSSKKKKNDEIFMKKVVDFSELCGKVVAVE